MFDKHADYVWALPVWYRGTKYVEGEELLGGLIRNPGERQRLYNNGLLRLKTAPAAKEEETGTPIPSGPVTATVRPRVRTEGQSVDGNGH